MSNYAPANTTAAWFQDDFSGAPINPNCGVIHTTETVSLPGYDGGATAPHYTAVPDITAQRLRGFAHFRDERSSRALRNLDGGVETNTLNAIQVELVGTCDPTLRAQWKSEGRRFIFWPEPPTWALADLAKFLADMRHRHGIRIQGPGRSTWMSHPASSGQGNPNRMRNAEWREFLGWCGHQHVPENSHGDPGSFPWDKVQAMALDLTEPESLPMPSPGAAGAPSPVVGWRMDIAREFGLENVDAAAVACRRVGLPFWAACALLEKESHGRNIYGHDSGGAGPHGQRVTQANFERFLAKVLDGATSNGVGPCQITWAGSRVNGKRDGGFFKEMKEQNLRAWVPEDNMRFGFALLRSLYNSEGDSWEKAGTKYNGSAAYGRDFLATVKEWRERLRATMPLNPLLDDRMVA